MNMRFLLALTMSLGGLCGGAQVIYQPGYIIGNRGDTAHGEIGLRNWHEPIFEFYLRQKPLLPVKLDARTAQKIVIPGWETHVRAWSGRQVFFVKQIVQSEGICLYENAFLDTAFYVTFPSRRDLFVPVLDSLVTINPGSLAKVPVYMKMFDSVLVTGAADVDKGRKALHRAYRKGWSLGQQVIEINNSLRYSSQISYKPREEHIELVLSGGMALAQLKMTGSVKDVGHFSFGTQSTGYFGVGLETSDPWWVPKGILVGGFRYARFNVAAAGPDSSGGRMLLSYRQQGCQVTMGALYPVAFLGNGGIVVRAGAELGGYFASISNEHLRAGSKEYAPVLNDGSSSLAAICRLSILAPRPGIALDVQWQAPATVADGYSYKVLHGGWAVMLSYHFTLLK